MPLERALTALVVVNLAVLAGELLYNLVFALVALP